MNSSRWFLNFSRSLRWCAPIYGRISRTIHPEEVQGVLYSSSRSSSSSGTFCQNFITPRSQSKFSASAIFCIVGPIVYYKWALSQRRIEQDSTISVDTQFAVPDEAWQPETSVDPFKRMVTVDGTEFWLLGLGVRTVSFLKLQVYAVGIYVAKDDVPELLEKVKSVSGKLDIRSVILDNNSGMKIFDALLHQPVRFALRIVPVRNTDFAHLRDGFVRSVMASIKSHHSIGDDVDASQGTNQLRSLFSRKLSVPKNGELIMAMTNSGELKCIYSPKRTDAEVLGTVTDRNVVNALMLHYLAGPKAASEEARIAFADSVADLLEAKQRPLQATK
ncbi:chalcone-flavanone isomerase-domain-containing protein [Lipomyces orientalis]|uniref:Chalcone-flavanone isomerase-domain-containing protein n=1 Tax=Lipomyces orientalis TaxID=1233043 RepID=A0ACC3TQ53_9ASCO